MWLLFCLRGDVQYFIEEQCLDLICSQVCWADVKYFIEEKTFRDCHLGINEEGMDMMELTDVFFLMLFGLFVRAKNNLKLLVSL